MSAPLAVPVSPSSSKRSRSRDSSRSAATSINTPSGGTPLITPSASAPSLIIPNSNSQTPSIVESSPQDRTPYPAFLQLSRADIKNKFQDLEWEQRRKFLESSQNGEGAPSQWAKVSSDMVMNRNRYANVDPYANNRVRLNVPEGHSDYINASPIVLKNSKSDTQMKFIATQGPKADTIAHVWRMIWHDTTSPAVVIMLTQTHESRREKCHPYFPQTLSAPTLTLNEHDEFEDGFTPTVTLKSLSNDEGARAQIRELEMKVNDASAPPAEHHGSAEAPSDDAEAQTQTAEADKGVAEPEEELSIKKIYHLLFAGWPDFAVPEGADRLALLKLIHMSRELNADNASNPRIIHCSAGVGRTGTFIAIDWLLQELNDGALDEVNDEYDPVVAVVEELRRQRMMMVQGEVQFSFIYDVLREMWRERWVRGHPEEAERLGVAAGMGLGREPSFKKVKKSFESEGESEEDEEGSEVLEDEDLRAELEAELVEGEMEFEKGKS